MTKLIIFQIPSEPDYTQELLNWAILFRIDSEVRKDHPLNTTHNGHDLLITSDLFINNTILSDLMQENERGLLLKVKKINEKWYPSFCFTTSRSNENFYNLFHSEMSEITDEIIEAPPMYKSSVFDVGILMWNLIIGEWYSSKKKDHISKLYYPFWIEAHHKHFLNLDKMDNFKWFQDQSCFCVSLSKIFTEKRISYNEFKDLIKNDHLTFNRCKEGLKRFVYEVDIQKSKIIDHPFSIPLSYECIAVGDEEVKVDFTKTVVTFLYDLSRNDRPMDEYMNSLKKFAKLSYPMVFFGEQSVCDQFIIYRESLSLHTIVIPRKLEDWEVFQKYGFIDENLNIDRSQSDRYKKLTVLKFWALQEAIDINAFPSDNYIWMDAGLYKYNLDDKFKDEINLFKNINSPEDKIIVESLSQGSGTTHNEYQNGDENILSAIIIGNKNGLKNALPLLKKLVHSKYEENHIQNEQKIMSRFDLLYPEFFIRRYTGYNNLSIINFLGL